MYFFFYTQVNVDISFFRISCWKFLKKNFSLKITLSAEK